MFLVFSGQRLRFILRVLPQNRNRDMWLIRCRTTHDRVCFLPWSQIPGCTQHGTMQSDYRGRVLNRAIPLSSLSMVELRVDGYQPAPDEEIRTCPATFIVPACDK